MKPLSESRLRGIVTKPKFKTWLTEHPRKTFLRNVCFACPLAAYIQDSLRTMGYRKLVVEVNAYDPWHNPKKTAYIEIHFSGTQDSVRIDAPRWALPFINKVDADWSKGEHVKASEALQLLGN